MMVMDSDNINETPDIISVISIPNDLEADIMLSGQEYDTLKEIYSEVFNLFKQHNYNGVLFLLPQLFTFPSLPTIFHLVIGCVMIRIGRLDGGFRELGLAIRLSGIIDKRIKYLSVSANMNAELNDIKNVQGCLAEMLDTIRMNSTTQHDFEMNTTILVEFEKRLFSNLESASEKEPIKCKSFEEQILELNKLKRYYSMDTFTGKCQFIVTKITTVEKHLEIWNKDKKTPKIDPLKYILEAIVACGPKIAYSGIRKIEPVLNQFIEYLSMEPNKYLNGITKSRSVSFFSKKKNNHGGNDRQGNFDEIQIRIPTKIAIIKAFMCMLRCQYGDAAKQFNALLSDVKEEVNLSLNLLKFYCQANESNLTKKNLELIIFNLNKLEYGGCLRYQILATVHEKLYKLTTKGNTNSKQKNNKLSSLFKAYPLVKPHLKSSIECYILSIISSPDDDLYIPQIYDKILSLLIYNNSDIRIITFFYQLRYYFTLRADYTYLHVPDLLHDYVPESIDNNQRLLLDIQQIIEHRSIGYNPKPQDIENVEEYEFVRFWIKKYQAQKELSPPLKIYHSYLFA